MQVLSGLDISECLVEFIFGHLDVFLYLTLNKLVNFFGYTFQIKFDGALNGHKILF